MSHTHTHTAVHSPNQPEEDGAIRASTSKQTLVDRVPGQGCRERGGGKREKIWQTVQDCTHTHVTSRLLHTSDALLTSFLCPLSVHSSFMARMSKILMRWSRAAVASQFPFLFHLTDITVALWAWLQEGEERGKRGGGKREEGRGRRENQVAN